MLRGSISKGLGIKKVGGCYATAFLTHGYSHRDPTLTMALGNIPHFLDAWAASLGHLSLSIQVVWDEMVHKLDVPYRWGKVTGPLSSAIATLLDWGFYPVSPSLWLDPDGRNWSIDPKAPNCVAAAREVLSHHFQKRIWATAAPANAEPLGLCPDIAPYFGAAQGFSHRQHATAPLLFRCDLPRGHGHL